MEFLFELLFEFLGEAGIQFVFEVLGEVGLHLLENETERRKSPVLAAIGFAFLGAVAGAVSLLIFPHSAIHNPHLRLANLLLTPVAVGWGMAGLGKWRERRGQIPVRLDRFAYAFIFALAMGLVRYLAAT